MDAKAAIQTAIATADMITTMYLGDLTDAEMLHRPAKGCNHIKWQMGHLISSEHDMLEQCFPGKMPALPSGFAEKYSRDTCQSDDPAAFDSKQELMTLYAQQRAGTLALLEIVSADELSNEGPEPILSYAPTVGAAFLMQDAHWLMHAGQWAVIRRQLGREAMM